jgi:Tfp pilus assembly protein PilE
VSQPPPHVRDQRYFLETGQWSTPTSSTTPAGLSQPQSSSIDDSVRRAVAHQATGQPASESAQRTSASAVETAKSRTGMVLIICLVVLGVLAAIVFAAYRHYTKLVTLDEMGISDKTYATWYQAPDAIVFQDVTFHVNTINSSPEDRKIKFCARREPGTKDICTTYEVRAHSTRKVRILMPYLYSIDHKNTTGPDQKVVKVDGFKVRA